MAPGPGPRSPTLIVVRGIAGREGGCMAGAPECVWALVSMCVRRRVLIRKGDAPDATPHPPQGDGVLRVLRMLEIDPP